MKLMNDLDILIGPVLNTFCQYKQIKLFKQKNSPFCSKHKHSHIHLKKKSEFLHLSLCLWFMYETIWYHLSNAIKQFSVLSLS